MEYPDPANKQSA